ncbi:hypothetical protein CDO73_14440 [Saccharibacillus sp. O23]|uniref:hypothetical protein n=1 Tax=Saccharibacillus sp. O23 TaxID=2009338 RepID=UPI000B4E1F60|nr:hypothetical protein [Saccharibacillus sp. O23]OWR29394.1 hypothetical protein CDO73_14440 [Saccharibacillus sp. O23]
MIEEQKVLPGQSIGKSKLGMSREELAAAEPDSPFYYQYEFAGDKAVFIELSESAQVEFRCLYEDMDLFGTPADELVPRLDAISPYVRDEDAELGFRYLFPQLGMLLWRSRVFREEDREAEWYREMPPENQEDERRFRFFETVAVFSPEWPGLTEEREA